MRHGGGIFIFYEKFTLSRISFVGMLFSFLLSATVWAGWPDFNNDFSIDCIDLAQFADAWDSVPGSSNWDPRCDIQPTVQGDGIIDQHDLKVVCDNWLAETPTDLNTPGATMQIVYNNGGFFEGVTWDVNSNKLFFTNMTAKRIMRLDSPGNPGSAYIWMNNSILTNGMFLGIDGRLLTADQGLFRVRSHRIGASVLWIRRLFPQPATRQMTYANCQTAIFT